VKVGDTAVQYDSRPGSSYLTLVRFVLQSLPQHAERHAIVSEGAGIIPRVPSRSNVKDALYLKQIHSAMKKTR